MRLTHNAHLVALLIWSITLFNNLSAQTFPVDTIQMTGPKDKRINLVFLGDGYTASEQAKYINDVKKTVQAIFNTVPFRQYQSYFNVFAIKVPSNQSGLRHANTASDCPSGSNFQPTANPDNYFGTQFDYLGIHRLVYPTNAINISNVLLYNFPDYDHVLMLGNSPYYGGSGGSLATSTTHSNASEIMIHEMGHSFAFLADEYWAGSQYASEKANMTANNNPATVKWKNWLGTPGIGIFQHSGHPWYKPASGTCKMEALNRPFCSVCIEAFVRKIFNLVSPLQGYTPDNSGVIPLNTDLTFKLDLLAPNPNTLRRIWKVNNMEVERQTDSLVIAKENAPAGNFTVQATILDTTHLTRADNHVSVNTVNVIWNLNVATGMAQTEVFKANLSIYPNPFADELVLQYQVDKASRISVELISLDGTKQVLLPESLHEAGSYRKLANISDMSLPNGLYFVAFLVDGQLITKEMMRIR